VGLVLAGGEVIGSRIGRWPLCRVTGGAINCPGTCSHAYPEGTVVTLTATPAGGSTFTGWSGGGCSGTGACSITMSSDQAVSATFTAMHTLSVSTAGSGSGSVTGGAINCPGTCSHAYPQGTVVALTATPAGGSTFTGWSGGGCSGSAGCSVTMSADQSVTATFTRSVVVLPAPIVGAARESATVWRESNALAHLTAAKHHKRAPVGTTFSFTLNEPARVSFVFTQRLSGRMVNGKCVAQSRRNRHSHACRRTVIRGTLSFAGHQGLDKVRFAGRISATHKLGLGRYTLQITATNAQGKRSATKSLSFTIVR
jgi:Divergent InlB B-repeat domain